MIKAPLTDREYWMGRDVQYPPSPEIKKNASKLLEAIHVLGMRWAAAHGRPPEWKVSSGYRPPAVNQNVPNASKRSAHQTGEAVDIRDPKQELGNWLVKNPQLLEEAGLYLENPKYTPTWCHLQTRPTRNRIFIP